MADNEAVAQHYNERPDQGRDGRKQSKIIHLRNFNNWIKSVLIGIHTRSGYSVLDLACGKGGDLQKWVKADISEYVGCDIAFVSLTQAVERYNRIQDVSFPARFLCGDSFSVKLSDHLPEDTRFDIVSCQFACHYAFENETRVRRLLRNVTERLNPGGFFIGTTPDANVLVRKLRAAPDLSFGTSIYNVTFDEEFRSKSFPKERPWGVRYLFSLEDSVENCPEFIVHFPSFKSLAEEYGLELLLNDNFDKFWRDFSNPGEHPEFHDLFLKMKVLDNEGRFSAEEWDAARLYCVFAFKKNGPTIEAREFPRRKWPNLSNEDIKNIEQ